MTSRTTFILLFLATFIGLASTWSVARHGHDSTPARWRQSVNDQTTPGRSWELNDEDSQLVARSRSLNASTTSKSVPKNSEPQVRGFAPWKRIPMDMPGGDMDVWMTDQLPQPIVWDVNPELDANTAIFRKIGRNAFSLGTSGLCGCTSLWVISRRGVYATHYWESISFAPEKDQKLRGETNRDVFERTVVQGLRSGVKEEGKMMQFKLSRDEIVDESIKAYLVHPQKSWRNGPASMDGYRNQWNRIKEVVNEIIPELAMEAKWEEIVYNRLDCVENEDELRETAQGRVLFKFNPDHNGRKKAALWVERQTQPYHDDEWN